MSNKHLIIIKNLKKVYPDGRQANCLFSKQNSEHM